MKRYTLGIILFFLFLVLLLSRDAITPEHFTGLWYCIEDAGVYQFQDGIIEQIKPFSTPIMDGAYCFSRNTITLFVRDTQNLNTVKTLYWISEKNNDYLCEDPDGKGTIYFSRGHNQE